MPDWSIALLLALLAAPSLAQVPARAPDLVLTGTLTGEDHQTYIRARFTLPEGTERLVVAFDHDGREERTTIDLGIEDPNGFRGASGGNKASFTLAATDATPSYLPGPLPPGEWALALAVPNIRDGATASWEARLWFLKGAEAQWLVGAPPGRGPGWYRGDLHLHTGHSDGSCDSRAGRRVPCPAFRTLEAAQARGLDFVALTEHNTTSHAQALRELASYFDDMLLIPGREITTFYGHFNVYGVTGFLDYRIMADDDRSFARIAEKVHALGGLVAINHPRLPSGEACMGCGWTMFASERGSGAAGGFSMVDAVEVVNGASSAAGGGPEGPVAAFPFWLEALAAGHRLAAIGSSDNHDPALTGAGSVGMPVTVVEAAELSQAAILQGIRDGRSFVDLTATGAVHLDFSVIAGEARAIMGGTLALSPGTPIAIAAEIDAPSGTSLEILDGTQILERYQVAGLPRPLAVSLPAMPGRHALWLRLRSQDGTLLATSSAVLVEAD